MDGHRPGQDGALQWVFEDDFGFDRYAEYVLDVPYLSRSVYPDDGRIFSGFHPESSRSSRRIPHGRLGAYLRRAPEVRLKRYMGRGAEPWGSICALPAVWVGLLYGGPRCRMRALVATWTPGWYLRKAVTKDGLQTVRDGTVQDIAVEMVRIAKEGLTRRGCARRTSWMA